MFDAPKTAPSNPPTTFSGWGDENLTKSNPINQKSQIADPFANLGMQSSDPFANFKPTPNADFDPFAELDKPSSGLKRPFH